MFKGVCYRFHNPRYSYNPYSGEGASMYGRRFNRVGVKALYLALTPTGAINEISQGAGKFPPQVIVCYDMNFDKVVDLSTDYNRKSLLVSLDDLACAWEDIVSLGDEPPSWTIADRFIGEGYQAMIVPSFASGSNPDSHFNLVAWEWEPSVTISHFDPRGDLPRNGASWR